MLPNNYESKFSGFIKMCNSVKADGIGAIVVSHPSVLGDSYEELIESLARLADAELQLAIVSRHPPKA